jgi:hypothetical protein
MKLQLRRTLVRSVIAYHHIRHSQLLPIIFLITILNAAPTELIEPDRTHLTYHYFTPLEL